METSRTTKTNKKITSISKTIADETVLENESEKKEKENINYISDDRLIIFKLESRVRPSNVSNYIHKFTYKYIQVYTHTHRHSHTDFLIDRLIDR